VKRKYSLLFTPKTRGKPGRIGPSPELILAIVEMKRRNPSFGYQRIADQISLVFDIEIEKDVVRRVLEGRKNAIRTMVMAVMRCFTPY
jgi:hypothetical protein